MPLVSLARFVGLRPELVVAAAFLAAGLASTLATLRLARRLEDPPGPLVLSAVLGFVTLVLPMGLFAQREHAALLLALPALAAIAVIGSGRPLPRRTTVVAGVAAGLVIAIKPHLALAILLPASWAALRRKRIVPLAPAILAAAVIVVAYATAALLFVPAYFAWIPVFTQTYLRMHAPLDRLALSALLFPATALAPVVVVRSAKVPTLAVVSLLGAIGFVLAAVLQAKNYANHWLPGSALALLAAALIICRAGRSPEPARYRSGDMVGRGSVADANLVLSPGSCSRDSASPGRAGKSDDDRAEPRAEQRAPGDQERRRPMGRIARVAVHCSRCAGLGPRRSARQAGLSRGHRRLRAGCRDSSSQRSFSLIAPIRLGCWRSPRSALH